MLKTQVRLASFMIGFCMTISLYILEFSGVTTVVWGYDSYYFTVLPFTIFLLSDLIPGEDTFFEKL